MALSARELEKDPFLRVLLLGPPKSGKTTCCIATSPPPVRVLLCEADSALTHAVRVAGSNFSFERTKDWNCLDDETEALTQRGWVNGFDLRDGDVFLTKNAATGALEWQPGTVSKFYDYDQPLIEFKTKSFHAVSTRNHRWLCRSRTLDGRGHDTCKLTEELTADNHLIHRTGAYEGPEVQVHSDEFVELVGWFLTDGTAPKGWTQVVLYQSERAKPYN